MNSSDPRPAGPPAAEAIHGRVLVVDDERPNRVYLRKLLTARGCDVIEAASGEEAVRLVREQRPDLVLADVVMPGLSGYDLCAAVKSDPLTAEIPVIMVTARVDIADLELGFARGAFDYIRKPFHPRELVVRVRNALDLKRADDARRLWQRQMAREMDVAGRLQRRLLDATPWIEDAFEVWVAYQPSLQVGGDVFDAIALPDGRLCVYVADVAGHGVGPAMVSSMLKAVISELARDRAHEGPAAIVRALNVRFRQYVPDPEVYATLLLALLDPAAGEWRMFNCGHPLPIWLVDGEDRSAAIPDRGDLPIGILEEVPSAPDLEIRLPATGGSTLVFYTDGLTEARASGGSGQFGAGRLATILQARVAADELGDPVAGLFPAIGHAGYDIGHDDCSAVAVRLPRDAPALSRQIAPELAAVDRLTAEIGAAFTAGGWSADAAAAVRLLAMEHGVNVLRHGGLPPGAPLRFQVRLSGARGRLTARDAGREWSFAETLQAVRSHARIDDEAGRGLAIIRAVASDILQYRRDNGNVTQYALDEARAAAPPPLDTP